MTKIDMFIHSVLLRSESQQGIDAGMQGIDDPA